MTRTPTVRAYEALLVLYPRPFRREYGDDMAMLFAEQLRDENTWRVCARAATDLTLTIPTRYLEVLMKDATSPFLTALFGAVAVAGLVFAVVSGTNAGLAIPAVAVALVAGGLSAATYRRDRRSPRRCDPMQGGSSWPPALGCWSPLSSPSTFPARCPTASGCR